MERRGLKVNLEKTKMMVTGGEVGDVVGVCRYPCGVCGRDVGANSVLCTACAKWCHKRCSGLGCLSAAAVSLFQCPASALGSSGGAVGIVGEVKQFCYLGDVLERGGGSERAIRARVGAAWGKWKEIASLLVNRSILLHHRGKVYKACIRPVMLYGGRRGHLLQDWRVYCSVVIEECSAIWLESWGGIVRGVRRWQGGVR